MTRLWSGVLWKSKNWVILKIQQRASLPSKRGTSSFMCGLRFGGGGGGGGGMGVEFWLTFLILATSVARESNLAVRTEMASVTERVW